MISVRFEFRIFEIRWTALAQMLGTRLAQMPGSMDYMDYDLMTWVITKDTSEDYFVELGLVLVLVALLHFFQ